MLQVVPVDLHDEDADPSQSEQQRQEPAAKACMLCGDEAGMLEGLAGGRVPCACSRGHAVCAACLRQYVLHTHGLQVRWRGVVPLDMTAFRGSIWTKHNLGFGSAGVCAQKLPAQYPTQMQNH